jgi:hypothetical protein
MTTTSTVVGVFTNRIQAEDAIAELRRAGFRDSQIGLVARTDGGDIQRTDGAGETMAGEGAVAGAVAGAGIGGLVGLGIISGVIPVIGPAIVAGTLGTILTNALGGAAIAGLVGALIGFGIPEDDARYYEAEVKGGRFLVTVDAGGRYDEAWDILDRFGAYNRTTAPSAASMGI